MNVVVDLCWVVVFGVIGLIGVFILDVIVCYLYCYQVMVFVVGCQVQVLLVLCCQYKFVYVVIVDVLLFVELCDGLCEVGLVIEVYVGQVVLDQLVVSDVCDIVVVVIVGVVGLFLILVVVVVGKCILLVNKELLVLVGELLIWMVECVGVEIILIDSEYSVIFQCLCLCDVSVDGVGVCWILLIVFGGLFCGCSCVELVQVILVQVVVYFKWLMGLKILVDLVMLMNKGLEVIEVYYLFGVFGQCIEVLVYLQSLVYLLVEFVDGLILVQMGLLDMCIILVVGFGWLQCIELGVVGLDLLVQGCLDFEVLDIDVFFCLVLVWQVMQVGGIVLVVFNVVNEEVVLVFFQGWIGFLMILVLVVNVFLILLFQLVDILEVLLFVDQWVCQFILNVIDVV